MEAKLEKQIISSQPIEEVAKSEEELGKGFHVEEQSSDRDRDPPSSVVEAAASSSATAENGRERLKRHRGEVAGQVWIPEMWGQEDFLKDWIDSTVFDAAVRSGGIKSARAALMEEGRRATAAGFRIQNSC